MLIPCSPPSTNIARRTRWRAAEKSAMASVTSRGRAGPSMIGICRRGLPLGLPESPTRRSTSCNGEVPRGGHRSYRRGLPCHVPIAYFPLSLLSLALQRPPEPHQVTFPGQRTDIVSTLSRAAVTAGDGHPTRRVPLQPGPGSSEGRALGRRFGVPDCSQRRCLPSGCCKVSASYYRATVRDHFHSSDCA